MGVEPIKVQIHYQTITQTFPISPEAKGRAHIAESLIYEGLPIHCSCNTLFLQEKNPNRQGYQFVQNCKATDKLLIEINTNTILSPIPPETTCFTLMNLCSAFFQCTSNQDSQYFSPSPGEDHNIPEQSCP